MQGFSRKVALFAFAWMLTGCNSPDFFTLDVAREVLEAQPMQLSGEQIQLTEDQVACGDREELWLFTQLDRTRGLGRLTDKGRALQLSDDVRVEPGVGATVQVTGKFKLRALDIPSSQDEGKQVKVVEVRTAVIIDHECFQRPVPTLMGVRKGEFTASVNPMFRMKFRQETWTVSELLH